jgi:hypothetical protein
VRFTIDLMLPTCRWLGSLVTLRGLLQESGDHVGGLPVARLEEVAVDVQRRRRVGVAEATADRPDRYAGGEQLGGVEVAEVVEPDAVEAGPLTQSLKSAGDRVGVQRP